MKLLVLVVLLLPYLNSYGQVGTGRNWVDSEVKHTVSKGNTVMMTNSLPKGGGVVYKNGIKYSYVVFWTRVFNQSATSIELKIKFPDVTFFKSPDSFIQIVLPKATMNMDNVQLFDYGLKNLQSLINDQSNQLSVLQKKIKPNEDYIFYTAVFIHIEDWGPSRAKFELKDQDLFYKISKGSDTTIIPCGSLYFKK
ncbi:MAG: hypothetical protein IM571_07735 [Chitinophagaceae bacterium]|jgi:hypothetical protein|nr:hypothetical protein [Chitinophagaceae bacterium]MCA6477831.1 hypothetical protein [Chitinophagaceae bacterium]MCA6496129.1 hypothetical protein [Chitinophagaceae bacterium]MCA6513779.1 hypothetical protein [Chitinophagaceae bacterium]